MNKQKVIFGIVLFLLGFIGVLSILTMTIPLPDEVEGLLLDRFSPTEIKLLMLINPTIMLIVAVLIGVFLHQKVFLDAPIIKGIISGDHRYQLPDIFKYGIGGGVISGVLIVAIGEIFAPIIPQEFVELSENVGLSLAGRFLYGGITEEILMRFGLMTLVVWLISKIFNSHRAPVYWTAILLSAFLFAIGHFPVAFQAVGDPSAGLLSYIIIGNSIGGIIFGWLYWKKGLEAAMIAHIFTHVAMVTAEQLMNG